LAGFNDNGTGCLYDKKEEEKKMEETFKIAGFIGVFF